MERKIEQATADARPRTSARAASRAVFPPRAAPPPSAHLSLLWLGRGRPLWSGPVSRAEPPPRPQMRAESRRVELAERRAARKKDEETQKRIRHMDMMSVAKAKGGPDELQTDCAGAKAKKTRRVGVMCRLVRLRSQ